METCGFVSWDILERVSPYVDLFLYDIKHMNEDKHKALTGVSNRLILSKPRENRSEESGHRSHAFNPGHQRRQGKHQSRRYFFVKTGKN